MGNLCSWRLRSGQGDHRQILMLLDHRLSHCKLPDPVCQDLSEAVRAAPALRELGLLHNQLSETGLRVLSEGLAWPQCRVQTLR